MAKRFTLQQEQGFYLDRDKTSMPKVPGIYVVYKCDYDSYSDTVDVIEPLYVGETANIFECHNGTIEKPIFHEHYDDFMKRANGSCHICYGVVPMEEYSEEDRKWIKDVMIFCEKPQINVGEEKEYYLQPSIDLSLNGFPPCWKALHINLHSSIEEF